MLYVFLPRVGLEISIFCILALLRVKLWITAATYVTLMINMRQSTPTVSIPAVHSSAWCGSETTPSAGTPTQLLQTLGSWAEFPEQDWGRQRLSRTPSVARSSGPWAEQSPGQPQTALLLQLPALGWTIPVLSRPSPDVLRCLLASSLLSECPANAQYTFT